MNSRFSVPVETYFAKDTTAVPRLTPGGSDLINLAPGDPALPVPDTVRAAVEDSMRTDRHGYTPPTGIEELREAVRAKFRRVNQLEYATEEVVVGMGSKQVIVAAFMSTLRSGDQVVIATPSFSMYPDMVRLAGGDPVIVKAGRDSSYKLTPRALEDTLDERTRWVVLNTPNNPTGVVYNRAELAALVEVILAHPSAQLVSDEIYEQLIYDESPHVSPAGLSAEARQRVLTVSGLSKTYGMTGWRIGYGAGPADLIRAMGAVQLLTTTCPPRVTQAAAVAALAISDEQIAANVDSLRERRDFVVDQLSMIPGLQINSPSAGLYVIADCAALLAGAPELNSGVDLAHRLRNENRVMLMPGELFDMPGSIRISFCIPFGDLEQGMERVVAGLQGVARISQPINEEVPT